MLELLLYAERSHLTRRAVVVAQLVEPSILTPEIRGSNPDIGKVLSKNCTITETKIWIKKPGMAP